MFCIGILIFNNTFSLTAPQCVVTERNIILTINIIFLTSHTEYMQAALTDHCSGYVLKPLTPEKIRHEIAHLRFPIRGLKR